MATFYNTGSGGNYPYRLTLRTDATINSQSIANNTSNVTIKASAYYSTGEPAQYNVINPTIGAQYIKVNGVTKYSGNFNADYSNTSASNRVALMEWTGNVEHNANGELTLVIEVYQDCPNVTTLDYLKGINNFVLTTIPRASVITSFPNFEIGAAGGVTVTAPRMNTGFTNTFELKIGSTLIKSSGPVSADSYNFIQADLDAIYALIPTSPSAVATVYVTTKSGATQIGAIQSASATATVGNDIIPTFTSVTSVETATELASIGLSANNYIKNISKPKFTINGAAGAKSSTITAYEFTFNNNVYTTNNAVPGTFAISGTFALSARVKDSRGRWSASKSINLVFHEGHSSITIPNFTIGSGVTITLGRLTSNVTHTVVLKFGNGTIVTKTGVGASVALTAAEVASIYDYLPTSTSGTVTAYATSFFGATQLGNQQSKTATATVGSDIVPSFSSVSVVETDATILALGMGTNQFAQNLSKPRFTASGGVAPRGTTIVAYEFTFNGVLYSSTTNTYTTTGFNLTGAKTLTLRVKDSRGRVSTIGAPTNTVTLTFHEYITPVVSGFTGDRTDNAGVIDILGDYVKVAYSGNISSLNSKNQLTYKIEYKERQATTYTTILGPTTLAVGTTLIDTSTVLGNGSTYFLDTKSYDIRFTVTDKVGNTSTASIPISTGDVPLSFGRTGIGAGKIWERGALDVGGEAYFSDVVNNISGSAVKQSNMGSLNTNASSNTGVIVINLGKANVMLESTITIRSYNYLAKINVGGYTYASTSQWHSTQAMGNVYGGSLNVRFSAVGVDGNRYVMIGDTNTSWGGYLHVSVDETSIAYGTPYTEPFVVTLETAYLGVIGTTYSVGSGTVDSTPTGTVTMFSGTTAPAGWLMCEGQAVSRTTYASLFGVIGTTYGAGDGSTTFNLPNMKGKVVVGYDSADASFNALGKVGGSKTHTLSVTEMPSHTHTQDSHNHTQASHNHTQNSHNHTASTNTTGAHTHTGTAASAGDHNHEQQGYWRFAPGATGNYGRARNNITTDPVDTGTNNAMLNAGAHTHSVTTVSAGDHAHTVTNVAATAVNVATTATNNATTATNQNTGGGTAHNNLQPYLVMKYIVKF